MESDLKVEEKLSITDADQIQEKLKDLFDTEEVKIDFSSLKSIDMAILQLFYCFKKKAREKDIKVCVVNIPEEIKLKIKLLGYYKLLYNK